MLANGNLVLKEFVMTYRKILPGLMLGWLAGWGVEAQVLESYQFSGVNLNVPDADEAGVSDTRVITSGIGSIGDLNVTLNIAGRGGGGFNGDLYVTLTHESGYSVLLNRPGRRDGSAYGYGDNGFNITLDDQAANGDVHQYRLKLNGSHTTPIVGALTGIWAPDARAIDPDLVLASNPRTRPLSSFNYLDASGSWTLFLADLESGGLVKLVSWALSVSSVPEPETYGLAVGAGLLGLAAARRFRWRTASARG